MKILIVIDSIGTGGAQKLKAELAKGLSSAGNVVEIFTYNQFSDDFFKNELIRCGIKIHASEKLKTGFSFKVLSSLKRVISNDFDVVISSMHTPSIYTFLALMGKRKIKFIVCEESSSMAPVTFFKRILFYLTTLYADKVVPNSFHEGELMKKLPGRSGKVYPIWNGYDVIHEPLDFSLKHHKENITELIVIGRVAYPKNGLNLLKGLSMFYERNKWLPNVSWIGRDENEKRSILMKEKMNDYLKRNHELSKHWNWLGLVDDVKDYYKNSDALLHLSIYEGLPNVICEAMFYGCFVIASSVCDHPRILGKDERGYLCDPNSPESICKSIEKLNETSAGKKVKIIESARKFAEKEFNLDLMTKKYLSLIS